MKRFDCIIIGGGPAGSTALRELAKLGVKVCLLDKEIWPRYKTCGGAISNRATPFLPFDWSGVIRSPLHHIKLLYTTSRPLEVHRDKPCAAFVMRDEFDQLLLSKGIEAGGIVKESSRVVGIEETLKGVKVYTKNNQYESEYLIAADGANSLVAKAIGLWQRPTGFALEVEINAPQEICSKYQNKALINYKEKEYGYAWVFPKGSHLSAGVVTWAKDKTKLKHSLTNFLQDVNLINYPFNMSGHALPDIYKKIWTKRILLTGDAAGLNDPLSGEGISYALNSGYLAAQHIAKALTDTRHQLSAYGQEVEAQILRHLKGASRIANLVYAHSDIFSLALHKSPGLLDLYFDIISGQLQYYDLPKYLLPKLVGLGPAR